MYWVGLHVTLACEWSDMYEKLYIKIDPQIMYTSVQIGNFSLKNALQCYFHVVLNSNIVINNLILYYFWAFPLRSSQLKTDFWQMHPFSQ